MSFALFTLGRFEHFALLVLRTGIGSMSVYHGYPLFLGGVEAWRELGKAVETIGINFNYPVFGFIGAAALFFGGMFLVIGLFTRLWCILLTATLLIAMLSQLASPEGFPAAAHALELSIVFFAMTILGPGRMSLDDRLFG